MLNSDITHITYSESQIKFIKRTSRIILAGVIILLILTISDQDMDLREKLFSLFWLVFMVLFCRVFNTATNVNCPLLIGTDNILIYTNPLAKHRVFQWSDIKNITLKKNIISLSLNNDKTYKFSARGLSISPEEILLQMRTHLK
jgi:hypothetical protein